MMHKTTTLALLLALFALVVNGQTTIYVKYDASGENDGTSWADAYTDLEAAIGAAGAGDAIWVAAGTYTPTAQIGGSGERFRAFQMKNEVAIYGGFKGDEDPATFNLDERDFEENETILSGDLGGGVHVYHVFRHVDLSLNNTAVLDGFTISGGKADGSEDVDKRGGGMLNDYTAGGNGSSPTIRNCIFKNNEATEGGAMFNSRYSSPVIENTVFENNTATDIGGAVYMFRNETAFDGCTFLNNTANGAGNNKGGGAIYVQTQNAAEGVSFIDCLFSGNTVNKTSPGARGGAIYASINPGFLTITGSTFRENEAQYGGALYHSSGDNTNRDDSDVKINNSTFEQNSAEYGGGILSDRHNTIVTSCIIRGNQATEQSGGFYGRDGSSQIINSLLSGNKSGKHGGGMYFNDETPEIINTTVSGNYAGERGGGVSMIGVSTVEIKNTIVWGNASPEGNELWLAGTATCTIDHSLYGDESGDVYITSGGVVSETNSLTINPGFLNPVAPTAENTPNILGNYFICGCTSPAIDQGLNAHLPAGIEQDLRGAQRIMDGNLDGTETIDLGAYEYDPTGCNALAPFAGDGSEENPYEISMIQQLYWIAVDPARWGYHYVQTANIDAAITEFWLDGAGWQPIGNGSQAFTGRYDGQGHSISDLHIFRPSSSEIGLFGKIDGMSTDRVVLENINLLNVDVTGNREVGALVGLADQFNDIINCHVSGTVKGNRNTGGLAGWARRTDILRCSSSADVEVINPSGALYHGGLVGHVNTTSTVKKSFATGSVSGRGRVGGLIGALGWNSEVENSYARGSVTTDAEAPMMGGLVGEVWNAGVRNSYSTGTVNTFGGSPSEFGGLVGNKTMNSHFFDDNNFWDEQTSEVSISEMGTGKSTEDMTKEVTFADTNTEGLDVAWDFDDTWAIDEDVNDGYPYLQFNLFAWTGSTDSDWETSGNWSPAGPPQPGYNIFIPEGLTHYPLVEAHKVVGNLSIGEGASLTIAPDASLTLTGIFVNEAGKNGLIIQSAETTTGSLIHHTADIEARAERFIRASNWSASPAVDWHMLSSPVNNQVIEDAWTPDGPDNDYDFYAWDESGTWLNQKLDNITHFNPGQGYLVAYEQGGTKTFTGSLNSGTVTYTLVHSGNGKDENGWTYVHGWNLLGNPYPSAIDWRMADRGNFADDFAYVYNRDKNEGAGGYETIDGLQPNAYIPAHQGFFVLVKPEANGNEFAFHNALRVHGPQFMKSNEPKGSDRLQLRLSSLQVPYFDETSIRLATGSAFEHDRRDALKLFSFSDKAPQLYSLTSDQAMVSINSIPYINEDIEISLGMRIPAEGEYTLSFQEAGPSFQRRPLYLIDIESGLVHDLKEESFYVFTATAGDDEDRFRLLFTQPDDDDVPVNACAPDCIDQAAVSMWFHNQRLYVQANEADALLTIYDLSGRHLQSHRPPQGLQSFQLNLAPGVYVARLSGTHSSEAMKLIIQP